MTKNTRADSSTLQQTSLLPSNERGGDALIVGPYRYTLHRWWGPDPKTLLWVLLNPSTADGEHSDATLERCIGFSQRAGYQRLILTNLFAYRCTEPKELKQANDPVGPENTQYVLQAAAQADRIIIGWGNHGTLYGQDHKMLTRLTPFQLWSFGKTKRGCPRHPLYLSWDESLSIFISK